MPPRLPVLLTFGNAFMRGILFGRLRHRDRAQQGYREDRFHVAVLSLSRTLELLAVEKASLISRLLGRRVEEALGETGVRDVAVNGLAGESFGDDGARGNQTIQIDAGAQAHRFQEEY